MEECLSLEPDSGVIILRCFLVNICVDGHSCCSKQEGSALTPNVKLTFDAISNGDAGGAGMFAVLVHLFKPLITFPFL